MSSGIPGSMTDIAFGAGEIAARVRIAGLLRAEIERVSNPMMVDREYLDGLEAALEIVEEFKVAEHGKR